MSRILTSLVMFKKNRPSMMFVNIFVWLCIVKTTLAGRILASICTPSYSHQVAFRPIWRELAKRGHEIVLLTTDLMEETENIKQIDLSFSYDILNDRNFSSFITNKVKNDPGRLIVSMVDTFVDLIFEQMKLPEVQELMQNGNGKFDLMMIEMLFPIHLGLVEKIEAPVIALTSLDAPHDLHSIMGNDVHPVLYPESILTPYSFPLTLWQRVLSTIGLLLLQGYSRHYLFHPMRKRMLETFGDDCRTFEELFDDIHMLFVNSNPIFHHIRPLAPNTITFGGGFHVEFTTKPLPKDLRTFLDSATDGIVYFSLGSNVKSNLLGDDLKQIFVDTFADLPYKVLWKFESEDIILKSENVMIRKWVPQSDILGHPNVKVFVTQCGLQSMEEAVMKHVPMIGLPFMGDQLGNGIVLQKKGFGILLEHSSLTKEIFEKAIIEVVSNNSYKQTVIEMAELMTDVEFTGLEKVVWWTEYMMRHKGAKHLKNPMRNIPFYQYYFLDVFVFLGGILSILFFAITKTFSIMRRRWCANKKRKRLIT